MIRTTLLLLFTGGLAIYARRDWFIALCGALLLMAVVQHPDMLRNVGGIQGLNPWNFLMLSVVVNWLAQRKQQGLVWDLPKGVTWLLVLYLSVVTVAFLRMIVDRTNIEQFSAAFLVSEHFINCVKWVIPGLILYDACRTRRRVVIALVAILGIYFLLAIQVIRWMPLSTAMSGESLSYRASKIIENEIGYNRVSMSMLLAGGSWAIAAAAILVKRWQLRLLMLGCAAVVVLGQALTAGRTGYGVWALVGITFGLLRWRKLLAIVPLLAVLVLTLFPGVSERVFQGFGGRQGTTKVEADQYEITSGRNVAWPYVIAEIKKAPLLGYGRLAMNRLGISEFLLDDLGESFAHPHNAYLEILLDNGAVGLLLIMPFYLFVIWRSLLLFRDRSEDLSAAAGGVTLALVLALVIAGVGSQTFYPKEGAVGMWAAIGVMLRVAMEKQRALAPGKSIFEVSDVHERRGMPLRWYSRRIRRRHAAHIGADKAAEPGKDVSVPAIARDRRTRPPTGPAQADSSRPVPPARRRKGQPTWNRGRPRL